mmetsp:Transcript_5227/g.8766  ORF Transcript_5227/g.8766 Transcript_5227/m.8766 type:complete len:490 (+) Transcript_5227:14-1483(+)
MNVCGGRLRIHLSFLLFADFPICGVCQHTDRITVYRQLSSRSMMSECWIQKCRTYLLNLEQKNIETRAKCWTQIVNARTSQFNETLNIKLTVPFRPFSYRITNASHHLKFLIAWNGLSTEKLNEAPRTYSQFEKKAKNWVCGRRAPNYGRTLFPEMILKAQQYATALGHHLFGSTQTARQYAKGLMYGYLAKLCDEKITLNNSKKTPLLFINAKKEKSETTALLRQYYDGDDLRDNKCIADYMERKHTQYCVSLKQQIWQIAQDKDDEKQQPVPTLNTPHLHVQKSNDNNQQHSNPQMISASNDNKANHGQHRLHSNGNPFEMGVQTDNELCHLICNLVKMQEQQRVDMQALTHRVHQLESVLTNDFNMNLPRLQIDSMYPRSNNAAYGHSTQLQNGGHAHSLQHDQYSVSTGSPMTALATLASNSSSYATPLCLQNTATNSSQTRFAPMANYNGNVNDANLQLLVPNGTIINNLNDLAALLTHSGLNL